MDESLFEKLMEVASAADKTKLAILHNAMVNNARAYKTESTAAHLKDWQSSEEALTRAVEEISVKQTEDGSGNVGLVDLKGPWKTKKAALLYLQASGWAIEKTTFYNQTNPTHKDLKLSKEKHGFTKKRVDKYAKEFLIRADSGLKVGEENSQLQREKLERENKKLDIDIATKEFNFDLLQGKYLPRDQLYLEIVGRAGILDSGFNFFIQSKALELVTLVSGDQRKVPEFIAALQKEWNSMLGNFARLDNIDVAFEDD